MTSPLNRRTVVLAAGSGMATLLLAACGVPQATRPSTTESTRLAAARSNAAPEPVGPAGVTVPPLESPTGSPTPSSSLLRQPLPLSSAPPNVSPTPTPASSAAAITPSTDPTTSAPTTSAPPTSAPPSTSADPSTSSTPRTSTPPPTTQSTPSSTATTPSTPTTPATTTTTPASTTRRTSTTPSSTTASSRPATPASSAGSARRSTGTFVVALDPGHNGANGDHPEIINAKIDGGNGYRNVCNTTGTQTDAGYPEHQFAFNVATLLRPLLQAQGVTVVMTRTSDDGVGPCTNVRAALENRSSADAVVSIHGDGVAAKVEGFYVLTATRPPAGPATAAASSRLARAVRDAMISAGFPPSNTLGSQGLWDRDDLTGLNKSTRPKILIECGNMRNPEEAGWMSVKSGQRRYAAALAAGTMAYLRSGS